MSASRSPKTGSAARIVATLKRLRARRARTVALASPVATERQRRREEVLASLDAMIARYDRLLNEIARGKPESRSSARKGGARSG